MFKELLQLITGEIYFDEPVVIKPTPHQSPVLIWEVVAFQGRLAVRVEDGSYHEVEEKDTTVIASLYQRLKIKKTA